MNLKKRCITLTVLTFFLILPFLFIHGGEVFTQTPTMDCDATVRAWKLSHNLGCRCVNGQLYVINNPVLPEWKSP
jgi:hypothetical protein